MQGTDLGWCIPLPIPWFFLITLFTCTNRRFTHWGMRQRGDLLTDDSFKHKSLDENLRILIINSWNFFPNSPINIKPALFLIMGLYQTGDIPLSEPMQALLTRLQWVNSLRPRPNRRHVADDIFKCIFLNENVWIPIKISLKFVPKGPINNILALVQIMAWRRSGDKPLSEPMMVNLPTHICVTRPQWVNRPLLPNCYWHRISFNILRSEQNGRNFADNIFKCILLNVSFQILMKFLVQLIIFQKLFR